ncbi:FadD3 family acyl-CoA ligase [Parasphingorhabdus sp. JC815]|uniref:FadD3 family acyl-CoA ligase n=1 Tax=Parasphingorhabdus sp. JC815 TaxID=3232140 RepID=UPI00345906D5
MSELPPTIPHLAQAAAAKHGDASAILEHGETWSYTDLWRNVRHAASALIHAGILRGDRIAIWAPNSREWIVAAIAAQLAGAAIVPLNTRLKGGEAGDILRRTSSRILFTVSSFLGADYPALIAGEHIPSLEQTICLDRHWADFCNTGDADETIIDDALALCQPDDISDIMFTSGTTGTPKGVLTTHNRILPMIDNWTQLVDLRQGDPYLIINPFFHSFGFKAGWVAAMIKGAVIVPMAAFDVQKTIEHIERDRIAFLPGPPTIYQSLLAELAGRKFDSSSLRSAMTGAATVPPSLIQRMYDELGFDRVLTAYGMTECTNITACRPGDSPELIANSCGKAIPGHEVRIADDEGREIPCGETGEILVRGYGVMLGYLDDPAATAETIDPDGWLHTGDIGTMDENGYVRITDRKKDMYISGGFNCYPAEVEKLLAAHPSIEMVAVIGVPDERMGEIGKAFVVLRPGVSLTDSELIAWARSNMANYKVPRLVSFVDALPQNASGKVMKTELRA